MPFFHSMSPKLRLLSISRILPSPWPLRFESEASLSAMARSLRCTGLIQPPVVRKVGKNYELIAGARRLEAARSLGWTRIPALVVRADSAAAVDMAMAENLARLDLTHAEEQAARQRLSALMERSLREHTAFAQSLRRPQRRGSVSQAPRGETRCERELPREKAADTAVEIPPHTAQAAVPRANGGRHRVFFYRGNREDSAPVGHAAEAGQGTGARGPVRESAEELRLTQAHERNRSDCAKQGSAAFRNRNREGSPSEHAAEAGQGTGARGPVRESAEVARGRYPSDAGQAPPKSAKFRRKTPVFPEDPDLFPPFRTEQSREPVTEQGSEPSAAPSHGTPRSSPPLTPSVTDPPLAPAAEGTEAAPFFKERPPIRRGVVRESALFLRSAHRLLQGLQESGLGADSACTEEDDCYFYTLRIPK
ncbi:MAG: ParB/RepB/Spo0J family partition protein [Clostridia bacterium]|nr:ParB/RepB/Spo0J family partition protein [Clostridia bacterium]